MHHLVNLIGMSLLVTAQLVPAADEKWIVEADATVSSLMDLTLRSAIAASNKDDARAALNRIRLRQSVARHAHREVVGKMLVEAYEQVAGLPSDESTALRDLVDAGLDEKIAALVGEQSDEALSVTTKLSWKLAAIELLVEAQPAGYKSLCEDLLVRVATVVNETPGDRSRALVALARGFKSGNLPAHSVRLLSRGLAGESYDMKRLRLGVLGQVGSAETLRVLKALKSQDAFKAVRENVDFAISKLSHTLEDDPSAKLKVLRTILAQEKPRSRLELSWALGQVVQDRRVELLGLLEARREVYASEDRYLEQVFANAISALRSRK